MKIVALDTYVTDFDGLTWTEFEKLGEFIRYPRSSENLVIKRSQDSNILITNKIKFSSSEMDALSNLKYIGILATGTNNVDLEYAKRKNIIVTNVPEYSTDSVAQHIISFILNYATQIQDYDKLVKAGDWHRSPDFCFYNKPIIELSGKLLGIIGYGAIGKKTAEISKALGMKILISEVPGRIYDNDSKRMKFEEVLKNADFLSLNCPLNENTKHLINNSSLSLMKDTAVLINTARGGLVDEDALLTSLNNRQIAHACLDVLNQEPPAKTNKLQFSEYCTITPHIAWGTKESRQRLINEAALNLKAYLNGELRNRI